MLHHGVNLSNNPHVEMMFRDDFKELVPMPTDKVSLAREIRFFQAYF